MGLPKLIIKTNLVGNGHIASQEQIARETLIVSRKCSLPHGTEAGRQAVLAITTQSLYGEIIIFLNLCYRQTMLFPLFCLHSTILRAVSVMTKFRVDLLLAESFFVAKVEDFASTMPR